MLNTQTSAPKQVLLRLPDDLALKLAKSVPTRQRNSYILNLVSRDLESQELVRSRLLTDAALRMNAIEAAEPELALEGQQWNDAVLNEDGDNDERNQVAFEKDWALSKLGRLEKPQK